MVTATRTRKPSKADTLIDSIVTDLVDAIENGAAGWQMPWTKLAAADVLDPTNAATGAAYRGGNRWTLALGAMIAGYSSGTWATYKQWESIGAQVRKGEKAQAAILVPVEHKRTEVDEETGEETTYANLFFRGMVVFNADQVDGWAPSDLDLPEHEPHQAAGAMIEGWQRAGMSIAEGGNSAHYNRRTDRVHVPQRGQFANVEHFYSTVAHEATHWTGHESRLNRDMGARFGDDAYAAEELVAELGAAIIAARLGIVPATRDDHAAYLAHWVRILKADPKHLWTVAGRAEAAVEHLDGLSPDGPS